MIRSKNLAVSHYFSQSPHTFSLLCPKFLLSTLLSSTLSLCSSFHIGDQVSHPYKTTGTIKNMDKQIVSKVTALSKFGRNRSVDMTLKFHSLQAEGFVTHNKADAANYEPHLKFCFFFLLRRVTQRSLENCKIKIKEASASCSLRRVLRHEPLLLLSASLSCSLCLLFFFLSLFF